MSYRRHLFALVLLLAPLGIVFWLGGAELRRLGERADNVVEAQALTLLRQANQALSGVMGSWSERTLAPTAIDLGGAAPATASWQLSQRHPAVLTMVMLDDQGELLFPRPNPKGLGLVLAAVPEHEMLRDAEAALEARALEQALAMFDAYLALQADDRSGQARARFRRATILKDLRAGEARVALEEFISQFDPNVVPIPDDVALLPLLARVALAQLLDDEHKALSLMDAIAKGDYDRINDPNLAAIQRRLASRVDAPERQGAVQEALLRDAHRIRGRGFADDYGVIARESIRRRIRGGAGGDTIYQVIVNPDGLPSLLVLRPATAEERQLASAQHGLPACDWLGVHANLDLLLYDRMGPFIGLEKSDVQMRITDPDGVPVLPRSDSGTGDLAEGVATGEGDMVADTLTADSAFGLVLRARPADPERIEAERSAGARLRLALLLALALTALTGAFLLWRTVRKEAEVARLKVNFVSRVSHELKTPLALVRMYGETLERGRAKSPEQQRKFAGIITRESERLTTLIDRILDFSRQGAGTLVYEPTDLDLSDVAAAVTDAYRPHVETRGVTLQGNFAHPVPARCDRNALESALVNLLENAAKYTPPRSGDDASDTAVAVRTLCEGDYAVLEVSDRGQGIPDGQHDRVFDSFFRASNAGEVRGAGLGLHLVRHFANAHGGAIRATPRAGGGTTFRLQLPLRPPANAEAVAPATPTP